MGTAIDIVALFDAMADNPAPTMRALGSKRVDRALE
jgi:hypothetical protein